MFLFSGEAGKWSENKSFPVLPGLKEDQGHLGKTGAQGPQGARREKGQDGTGTSGMNYVGWRRTSCLNGSQTFFIKVVRITGQDIRPLCLHSGLFEF